MAQALLSDADVGLAAAPSDSSQAQPQYLSDADVGLSPAKPNLLSNSQDDGWVSGALKGAGTAVVKGLSHIPGQIGDMGNFADYLLARGVSAATGKPVDQVLAQQEAAKAAHSKSGLGRLESAIDPSKVLPTSSDVSAPVLSRTGEYEPTSEVGRVAQSGLETAIGALGPGGGAASVERGVMSAVPRVGATIVKNTVKAAPAAAVAGGIAQGVTDATGDPLLGMAVSTGALGAAGAGTGALKKAVAPFAEDLPIVGKKFAGTRDRMVGQALLDTAEDPKAFEHSLFPGPRRPNSDETVPGSVPTTGQLTGDMGILRAEGEARRDNNVAFNNRDAEQNSARRATIEGISPDGDAMSVPQTFKAHLDAIDSATQQAVDRLAAASRQGGQLLGPGSTPEANGAAIRQALEAVKADAKAARSALYRAVDPDNTLALVSSPVREAAQRISGNVDPFGRPMAGDEARIFSTASQIPDVMKFNSLHAFEQDVTAAMSEERRARGETPTYARLSQLKGAVQDAIHTAVENQARHQEAAVLTGQLAPEQTMAARLQADAGQWQHGRAEATGTDVGGDSSAASTGRTRSVRSFDRAEVSSGGRSGNVAGDQGLSPQRQANGDSGINQQSKPSLLQFLASKGGLGPDAELDAIGASNHVVGVDGVGRRRLVKQGGFPLDYAREAAEEAGYLRGEHGATSTPRDLLDAIDAEIRGQKRYPVGYEGLETKGEIRARSEREQHEYDQFLHGLESDLNAAGHGQLTGDLKDRALQLMERHRLDPDTAVERAFAELEQEDAIGNRHSDFPGDRPQVVPSTTLAPNFDQGAADRLSAAKTAHADYARTFKQGAPGQILKSAGFNGQYAAPDAVVPSKAVVRGDAGYSTLKSVLNAARNSPVALSAIQDQALAPLRATLAPDGSLTTGALTRWKQAYGPALRAIDEVSPGFSGRFDNAARATDQLVEAGAQRKAQLDEFQKTAAAKFLGASTPTEVENRLATIIKSPKDGPRQMHQLVAQAASNPEALAGLRKAGADWIMRNFSASAEAGVSGQKDLKSASFQNFLRDAEPALRPLYSPQQISILRAISSDLERANRTVTATRIKGSPGTAKDLAGLLKKIPESAKHSSLMTAGIMAAVEAYDKGGPWAAALAAALGSGGYIVHTLRSAGINSVQDMMRDALLNPERARFYISKVEPHPNRGPLPALAKSLRRQLIVQQVTDDQKQ